MASFKIPFSNYFTREEVIILGADDKLMSKSDFSLIADLEGFGMVEYFLRPIHHPVWHYQSTELMTNEIEDNHGEVVMAAGRFLRSLFLPVLKKEIRQIAYPSSERIEFTTPSGTQLILLRSMRPFMYPYNWFHNLIEGISSPSINKEEIQLLLEWKTNRKSNHRELAHQLLSRFLSDDIATLDSNPEVIPAAYLHMDLDKQDHTLAQVMEKVARIHPEAHIGRIRLEAVKAVWANDWNRYLSLYEKIPVEIHDYDPVPRFFVSIANQYKVDSGEDSIMLSDSNDPQDQSKTIEEQKQALALALGKEDYKLAALIRDNMDSRNKKWFSTMMMFNECTYYGGIPMFILWSIRGCWEYERGEFIQALRSKKIAFQSGFQKEYVAIQIAVILNKLERYEEVLELFDHEILNDLYYNQTDEEIIRAVTQINSALQALDSPARKKQYERYLLIKAPSVVWTTYQNIKEKSMGKYKKKTPFERALVGCFGQKVST